MRAHLALLSLLALGLSAVPALAGNVATANGQITWQSAQCTAPTPPASLAANSESKARDLNARVAEYNAYVQTVRAYADCLSNEAQHDANAMSQAIIGSAQSQIEAQNQTLQSLGAPLHLKSASK